MGKCRKSLMLWRISAGAAVGQNPRKDRVKEKRMSTKVTRKQKNSIPKQTQQKIAKNKKWKSKARRRISLNQCLIQPRI